MATLPTLRLFNEGPSVRILQRNLVGLNFRYNGLEPTGVFDLRTEDAVKDFQSLNRLTPDGIVGPVTWSVLLSKVRRIQTKLNSLNFNSGTPDGIYGPRTADAVRRFQLANGLVADGVVTPRTRQQLFNPNPPDDYSKIPSSTSINELHPYVASLARKFLALTRANGLDVTITSTFRSWDDQDALYAQGRTLPGPIVTNAMGGDSYHNWGLAFDAAPVVNGMIAWNDIAKFEQMGRLGEQAGLEWGGNWTTFYVTLPDMPHFQYNFGLSTEQLLNGARPPQARWAFR